MPDRLRKRPPCQAHDRYRERRGRGSRVASSRPGTARWCVISVRPINTCQCPLWGAHTAFVFLRGQPPGNRNKWWRQFWRRVSDYQPVLMRRRDGRQRCHRTCEVISLNVSARRSARSRSPQPRLSHHPTSITVVIMANDPEIYKNLQITVCFM